MIDPRGVKPHVRRAEPQDADGIAAVRFQTWRSSYASLLPTVVFEDVTEAELIPYWRSRFTCDRPRFTWVAVSPADQIVGFVDAQSPSRPEERVFDAELDYAYVLQSWQGQGLGRRLLEGLARDLSEAGIKSVGVRFFAANHSGEKFYRRMGALPYGERVLNILGCDVPIRVFHWPDIAALQPDGR